MRHMAQDLEQRLTELFGVTPTADERRALDSLVDSQLSEYLDPAALGPTEPLESLERHFTSVGSRPPRPSSAPISNTSSARWCRTRYAHTRRTSSAT